MWLGSSTVVAVAKPAAVALIGPLAWELPHAADVALKKKRKKTKTLMKEIEDTSGKLFHVHKLE